MEPKYATKTPQEFDVPLPKDLTFKIIIPGIFVIRNRLCFVQKQYSEGVYVTIGNLIFCLFFYLTGVHFLGELERGGDKKSSIDQSELEK